MQLNIFNAKHVPFPSQTIGAWNMVSRLNPPKDSQGSCHRDPFLCVPCVPCRFDICLFGVHGCNRYTLSNASWACHVGTHCRWSNGISLSHAHNPYILGTNLFDCREGRHCKMCIYALICHVDKAHIKCNRVEAFHEDSCGTCDNMLSCDHEDSRCTDCMIDGLSHVRRHCIPCIHVSIGHGDMAHRTCNFVEAVHEGNLCKTCTGFLALPCSQALQMRQYRVSFPCSQTLRKLLSPALWGLRTLRLGVKSVKTASGFFLCFTPCSAVKPAVWVLESSSPLGHQHLVGELLEKSLALKDHPISICRKWEKSGKIDTFWNHQPLSPTSHSHKAHLHSHKHHKLWNASDTIASLPMVCVHHPILAAILWGNPALPTVSHPADPHRTSKKSQAFEDVAANLLKRKGKKTRHKVWLLRCFFLKLVVWLSRSHHWNDLKETLREICGFAINMQITQVEMFLTDITLPEMVELV